jgi:hypothetical protein
MGFFSSIGDIVSDVGQFVGKAVNETIDFAKHDVIQPATNVAGKIFGELGDMAGAMVPEAAGELLASWADAFTAPIDAFLEGTPLKDAVEGLGHGAATSILTGTIGGPSSGSSSYVTLDSLKHGYGALQQNKRQKAQAVKPSVKSGKSASRRSYSYYGSRRTPQASVRRVVYK